MRRLCMIVLAVCCVAASLCSCDSGTPQKPGTTTFTAPTTQAGETTGLGTGELSIAFSVGDSLNPYEAVSAGNLQLAPLLYDSLTRLDENLNPILMLAESIEITGKTVIVRLKDAKFSDGSAVTAEDVTYSLGRARKSEASGFQAQLAQVYSYGAANASTVEIVMKRPDLNAAALLDFPIIKRGTSDRKNEDDKELPPIGGGRYVYQDDSGRYSLQPNRHYHGVVPTNSIVLNHTPDNDALDYSIKTGSIDFYYSDLRDGSLPAMNGQITLVNQTNFVFLGVNCNRGLLKEEDGRLAIAQMINRKDLAQSAYLTYASPALTPYSSGMSLLDNWENILSETENLEKVIEHLAKLGYNNKDNDSYYLDKAGNQLSVQLLYNSDNAFQSEAARLISQQLNKGGIACKLQAKKRTAYLQSVAAGDYDLYLGEVRPNKNFDLSPLLSKELTAPYTTTTSVTTAPTTPSASGGGSGGSAAASSAAAPDTAEPELSEVYEMYQKGETSTEEFLTAYFEAMPAIPLLHRKGALCYSAGITPAAKASVSDVYYNIEQLSAY